MAFGAGVYHFHHIIQMLDKSDQCLNPIYNDWIVFTNRALLELYYTSVEFHKVQKGKYYETLSMWLQQFGTGKTGKAVNSEVKNVEAEYTRLLKMFQARKGTS